MPIFIPRLIVTEHHWYVMLLRTRWTGRAALIADVAVSKSSDVHQDDVRVLPQERSQAAAKFRPILLP